MQLFSPIGKNVNCKLYNIQIKDQKSKVAWLTSLSSDFFVAGDRTVPLNLNFTHVSETNALKSLQLN